MESNVEPEPPKDKYKGVYMIMILLGVSLLLPWNMFITARAYFIEYKMSKNYTGKDTVYAEYFLQSVGFASQAPNILFNWINIFIKVSGSVTVRVIVTVCVKVVMVFFTIVLAIVNTSDSPAVFFWCTMVTVVIINMAIGMFQNVIFGIAGNLPVKYTAAVLLGCNFSGTIVTVIDLITTSLSPNIASASISYFVLAMLLPLAALCSYFMLFKTKYYRHYGMGAKQNSDEKTPYWSILKTAFPQLFSVFFSYFVTLSIFPGIQANIQRSDPNFFIPEQYYVKIMCFLIVNTGTTLGSIGAIIIKWPSPERLLYPVLLRSVFIPLLFFCNYQPIGEQRRVQVLILNDWVYGSIGFLMGLTAGFFSTKGMMYCTSVVEAAYSSLAGMFGAAFLVTGVFCGVGFSSLFPFLAET